MISDLKVIIHNDVNQFRATQAHPSIVRSNERCFKAKIFSWCDDMIIADIIAKKKKIF